MNYYNEIDPYAAQWLRNLIDAGHIARGDVDERSIVDVRPDELAGYTQCHFFAGVGGWSVALRLAGWPDDRPVWTGSCPCQPFSAAGKGEAADDERHLWPAWFPLIAQRHPAIVFGEQVEAAIGWGWLDAVFADLEGAGYACGAAVLPACGVGAPHIRQRTWFVADAMCGRARDTSREGLRAEGAVDGEHGGLPRQCGGAGLDGAAFGMADPDGRDASAEGLQRSGQQRQQPQDGRSLLVADPAIAGRHEQPQRPARTNGRPSAQPGRLCDARELGDSRSTRFQERKCNGRVQRETLGSHSRQTALGRSDAWDCAWLPCTDGKARPVEPSTFPLAHGIPGRVGRLRAYGNAIVPQVAAEFIKAACD